MKVIDAPKVLDQYNDEVDNKHFSFELDGKSMRAIILLHIIIVEKLTLVKILPMLTIMMIFKSVD